MMEDTVKVMVDLKDDPNAPIGEWEAIHHEHGTVPTNRKACPVNLEVCGCKVKRPKGWKKKKKKAKKQADAAGDVKNEQDEDDADEGDGADEAEDDKKGESSGGSDSDS